jgi:hypothetical protein
VSTVTHIKIIGWLHVAMGLLGLLVGVLIAVVFGGVAAITASPYTRSSDPNSVATAPVFAGLAIGIMVVAVVLSVPSLIVGIGLVLWKPWARILAIILSGFHLLNFPIGTALGAYGLWALLSKEGEAAFNVGRASGLPTDPRPLHRA